MLYYYILRTDQKTLADNIGEEFASAAEAYAHGVTIAQELMRNRERETRLWTLLVCDDYLRARSQIPFAMVS